MTREERKLLVCHDESVSLIDYVNELEKDYDKILEKYRRGTHKVEQIKKEKLDIIDTLESSYRLNELVTDALRKSEYKVELLKWILESATYPISFELGMKSVRLENFEELLRWIE